MHRTKVRIVEDALDANNTIARANRADFDRARRHGRQPDERARRRQDDAARARRGRPRRACASACSRATSQGSLDADRLASLHVPVTQLNTDAGLRRRVPPRRQHGPLGAPGAAARRDRPARDRERRQPRLPGRVPGRRGRARDGLLGHRGRGQAAQVPADVPHLRARDRQQDRPARRTSTSTSTSSSTTSTQVHPGVERIAASAPAPARASTPGATGCCAVARRDGGARRERAAPSSRRGRSSAARRSARGERAVLRRRRPSGSRGSATGWPSASRAAAG